MVKAAILAQEKHSQIQIIGLSVVSKTIGADHITNRQFISPHRLTMSERVKSFNEVNNDIKDQTTNLYI